MRLMVRYLTCQRTFPMSRTVYSEAAEREANKLTHGPGFRLYNKIHLWHDPTTYASCARIQV